MAPYEQISILDSSKTFPTLPTPQKYNIQNKGWKNQDQTKNSLKNIHNHRDTLMSHRQYFSTHTPKVQEKGIIL